MADTVAWPVVSAEAFFTANRLLFDSLRVGEDTYKPTQTAVAQQLGMTVGSLRRQLMNFKFPTNMVNLKHLAASVSDSLGDPPLCYQVLQEEYDGPFDLRFAELITPISPYHFDHQQLIIQRMPEAIHSLLGPLSCQFPPYREPDPGPRRQLPLRFSHFKEHMEAIVRQVPACIQRLSEDELYEVNNKVSIIYLWGQVTIPKAGVASPHLLGTVQASIRRHNTGYLLFAADPTKNSTSQVSDVFQWLKANNPLYENATAMVNIETFTTKIGNVSCMGMAHLPNAGRTTLAGEGSITVKVRFVSDERDVYVSLEKALCLAFPLIFPRADLQVLPGTTLRQKTQNLLSSHPYFRCGRLKCSMILWLYSLIEEYETTFVNRKLSFQPLRLPFDASRDAVAKVRRKDPAFREYWIDRQTHVRAMSRLYGHPDLMLTFTFNNKWAESLSTQDYLAEQLARRLDLRFCPVDTLDIWNERFASAKRSGFSPLISAMGFGKVWHYIWRLEFQARGAPHVHALIWLEEELTFERLMDTMFASEPDKRTPKLREYVTQHMYHSCTTARCRRGNPAAPCRYGFPKSAVNEFSWGNSGRLIVPRGYLDAHVVEYNPYFLAFWEGHCHVNILKTREKPLTSNCAVNYILKYNFKQEPNMQVDVGDKDNDYHTLFKARFTSCEEACARILGLTFCESDVASKYLRFRPRDKDVALFRNGEQVQLTALEKYFHRPREVSGTNLESNCHRHWGKCLRPRGSLRGSLTSPKDRRSSPFRAARVAF